MVTWQAIPEDRTNGIILAYVVKVLDTGDIFYVCDNSLTWEIQGLEKSMLYKIKVAGVTSKGDGIFSEETEVVTNLDGRSDRLFVFSLCCLLKTLLQ